MFVTLRGVFNKVRQVFGRLIPHSNKRHITSKASSAIFFIPHVTAQAVNKLRKLYPSSALLLSLSPS